VEQASVVEATTSHLIGRWRTADWSPMDILKTLDAAASIRKIQLVGRSSL